VAPWDGLELTSHERCLLATPDFPNQGGGEAAIGWHLLDPDQRFDWRTVVQRSLAGGALESAAVSILFLLLAALEAGQPHCYLKDSARNENISIVARDGYQVVVRFTDGSIAFVDDDNLICEVWR
jgi:hypothetical protein